MIIRSITLHAIAAATLPIISFSVWGCAQDPVPMSVAGETSVARSGTGAGDLVTFSAMGDVPYAAKEEALLAEQLAATPEMVEFSVHVGDIKRGFAACEPGVYRKVKGILAKSPKPLFIVPGDNEWNDCGNPAEALKLWTENFQGFEQHWDLPFVVKRDPQQEVNFSFVQNGVLFLGLHVVGGRVHDVGEWLERHEHCRQWTKSRFATHGESVVACVVFLHARPSPTQADFFGGFSSLCEDFQKPVLLIHGDGHKWMKDRPFTAKNILRIQVDQGGIASPLVVTVVEDPEQPFRFDRRKSGADAAE